MTALDPSANTASSPVKTPIYPPAEILPTLEQMEPGQKSPRTALVVFSGGQDSTTCLAWALNRFSRVEAVFFDYGQRHRIEVESARRIAQRRQITLHELSVPTFGEIGGNALVDSDPILLEGRRGLPSTFVPGRNLVFMTFAGALAWKLGIQDLITGVCQTDYSGYPDCRQDTMEALQKSLELGMEWPLRIHTPLMYLTKAQTVALAQTEGALQDLAYSHTCYEGLYPPCGTCPACELRAKGFAEAGIPDPILAVTDRSPQLNSAQNRP
jgi:7-cyano-7-deazaguanine synthase